MKKNLQSHLKGIGFLRLFCFAAGLLLLYKLLFDFDGMVLWQKQIMAVISPFLAGFVIAYCVNIPCRWLEGKLAKVKIKWVQRIAKPVSILFVYAVIALLAVLTVGTLVPMVYDNTMQFIASLPAYVEETVTFLQNIPPVGFLEFDLWINSLLEAKPWNSLLTAINTNSFLDSFQYVTSFFSSLFGVVLALISSVYFLIEFHKIEVFVKRLINLIPSAPKRRFVLKTTQLLDMSFRKFVTCQLLDSLVIGTLTTIEFAILGSPYALLLGLMLAVANIVPYFGSIIGTILAVVITAFTGGFETALLTTAVLIVTQQIDANFIQPKIMGASFSISPILIIIGITIGGSLGGIVGMIFAIPVVNVMKTGLEEAMSRRERSKSGEKKQSLTTEQNT